MSPRLAFAAIASLVVVAAIVAGMAVIGPPQEARERRLDEQRLRDLQAISTAVEDHASAHGELPASLDELKTRPRRFPVSFTDPVSGAPYKYAVEGASAYRLCARFEAASEPGAVARGLWEHPPGRHCFTLEAPLGKRG